MRQVLLTLLGYGTACVGAMFGAWLEYKWPLDTAKGKNRFAALIAALGGLYVIGAFL